MGLIEWDADSSTFEIFGQFQVSLRRNPVLTWDQVLAREKYFVQVGETISIQIFNATPIDFCILRFFPST